MNSAGRREVRERIDRAVHELHQAEVLIRSGRPVDAAVLRRIRDELVELKERVTP
jgi:hypothetical protein